MRSLLPVLIGLAFSGLSSQQAFAWAREGHEVVAIVAERLISPDTRAKVNQLLAEGGDKTLVSVACWADDVVLAARGEGPLTENAEAQVQRQICEQQDMAFYQSSARNDVVRGSPQLRLVDRCG
jgi:hypothetical protein